MIKIRKVLPQVYFLIVILVVLCNSLFAFYGIFSTSLRSDLFADNSAPDDILVSTSTNSKFNTTSVPDIFNIQTVQIKLESISLQINVWLLLNTIRVVTQNTTFQLDVIALHSEVYQHLGLVSLSDESSDFIISRNTINNLTVLNSRNETQPFSFSYHNSSRLIEGLSTTLPNSNNFVVVSINKFFSIWNFSDRGPLLHLASYTYIGNDPRTTSFNQMISNLRTASSELSSIHISLGLNLGISIPSISTIENIKTQFYQYYLFLQLLIIPILFVTAFVVIINSRIIIQGLKDIIEQFRYRGGNIREIKYLILKELGLVQIYGMVVFLCLLAISLYFQIDLPLVITVLLFNLVFNILLFLSINGVITREIQTLFTSEVISKDLAMVLHQSGLRRNFSLIISFIVIGIIIDPILREFDFTIGDTIRVILFLVSTLLLLRILWEEGIPMVYNLITRISRRTDQSNYISLAKGLFRPAWRIKSMVLLLIMLTTLMMFTSGFFLTITKSNQINSSWNSPMDYNYRVDDMTIANISDLQNDASVRELYWMSQGSIQIGITQYSLIIVGFPSVLFSNVKEIKSQFLDSNDLSIDEIYNRDLMFSNAALSNLSFTKNNYTVVFDQQLLSNGDRYLASSSFELNLDYGGEFSYLPTVENVSNSIVYLYDSADQILPNGLLIQGLFMNLDPQASQLGITGDTVLKYHGFNNFQSMDTVFVFEPILYFTLIQTVILLIFIIVTFILWTSFTKKIWFDTAKIYTARGGQKSNIRIYFRYVRNLIFLISMFPSFLFSAFMYLLATSYLNKITPYGIPNDLLTNFMAWLILLFAGSIFAYIRRR